MALRGFSVKLRTALLLLLAVTVAGCNAVTARHKVHYTFLESPETRAPKKVVLLPADITVGEMSAGGVVERVDDWSKQANAAVNAAIRTHISTRNDLQLVEVAGLSNDDLARVEQHRALYDQVAGAAFIYNGPGWEHKRERFDYTLGNGLRFLKQKTGADAAIFVIGNDRISTGGRKALAFLGAAFGVGIQVGYSFLTAGIVDLNTGDVLWLDYAVKPEDPLGLFSKDMRQAAGAQAMVSNIFRNYPGLAPYQKTKVAKTDG